MKICVIMQGHSGSGKSTLAKHIANVIDAEIFSTDELFIVDGVYKFDPTKLGFFHKMNIERAIKAMDEGKNIVIDNTNLRKWEAKNYAAPAIQRGYTVKFVRATGDFQNTHGVPPEKVAMMKASIEDLTLDSVLASEMPNR